MDEAHPRVKIDGHEYRVKPEVAAEIDRLQQLAKAWEEDARKYAGRLKELMEETT